MGPGMTGPGQLGHGAWLRHGPGMMGPGYGMGPGMMRPGLWRWVPGWRPRCGEPARHPKDGSEHGRRPVVFRAPARSRGQPSPQGRQGRGARRQHHRGADRDRRRLAGRELQRRPAYRAPSRRRAERIAAAMRIAPRLPRACPWYLRPFFWNQRRKYGEVLDASLLWARSPRLFLGVAALYGVIDRARSPLERGAALAPDRARVADQPLPASASTSIRRCCCSAGSARTSSWRSKAGARAICSDARERAALDYAEAITRADREVDDALMARAPGAFRRRRDRSN